MRATATVAEALAGALDEHALPGDGCGAWAVGHEDRQAHNGQGEYADFHGDEVGEEACTRCSCWEWPAGDLKQSPAPVRMCLATIEVKLYVYEDQLRARAKAVVSCRSGEWRNKWA